MRARDQWFDPDFTKAFETGMVDPDKNWYEHEVNIPNLLDMIPIDTRSILDYGCGNGFITAKLVGIVPAVAASDISEPLLEAFQEAIPEIRAFEWDATQQPLPVDSTYDCVFVKLVLQFVDDLDSFAKNIKPAINPGGSVVVSIPHPMQSAQRAHDEYFEEKVYTDVVGRFMGEAEYIHRSLQEFLKPFFDQGFVVDLISEPRPTDGQIRERSAPENFATHPKRINIRMRV